MKVPKLPEMVKKIRTRCVITPEGCWEWSEGRSYGYGRMRLPPSRQVLSVHRVVLEACLGFPLGRLLALHRCDNPPCCNPRHLFVGTAKDNAQDMLRKGRHLPVHLKGEQSGRAILSELQVLQCRRRWRSGERIFLLAREFGVTGVAMSLALRGKTWKHLPQPVRVRLSGC